MIDSFFRMLQQFLAAPMQDKVATVLFVMSISVMLWMLLQLLKL